MSIFQSPLKPSDTLEAFFSVTDESGAATEDSELLFVNAKFGGNVIRLYRFQHPEDNSIDYYDEEGRSARQFLLRNPVPNGKFRSGFGMRRHPILKYSRMHTGVDWSAPPWHADHCRSNGVVEKASWDKGGYGRQTIIRHANGYESSYSHQHTIAKALSPAPASARGSHRNGRFDRAFDGVRTSIYELIVNGNKVDPMRIRLPDGKVLERTKPMRCSRLRTLSDQCRCYRHFGNTAKQGTRKPLNRGDDSPRGLGWSQDGEKRVRT